MVGLLSIMVVFFWVACDIYYLLKGSSAHVIEFYIFIIEV